MAGRSLTLVLAVVAGACSGPSRRGGDAGGGGGTGDAERLYQEGLSWTRKAETAPLPAPPPAASGVGQNPASLAAPAFQTEELRALESFEKALAAQPDHAGANLALADLLAPHAIRHYAAELQARESAARSRPRRGDPASDAPVATPAPVIAVDASPARVIRAYEAAVQADPGRTPVDRLIAFAVRVGRLDAAESGHQELLRRVKESAEPYALYGDFLSAQKKDLDGAVDQYRQALIWKPDDQATRQKLGEIYLVRGIDYYSRQEFARAAVEFRECQKYVTGRESEQGRRLQTYLARMKEIRR